MDPSSVFVEKSRELLARDYLPKIERCLAELTEADVWWRPNETSNSVGNLLLHLAGNVTQWIVGGVGGRPYERNRQQEFDERTPIPTTELLARVRSAVETAGEVLGALTASDLVERRTIQGHDVTVLEAIYHVVEHFGMHTGQIILIAKMRAAGEVKLWRYVAREDRSA